MSFHFCYFAHFCSFLCILTNPASEIPLLLFINIRQFPCFETMGRFSLSPCEKECALAHSRAEARLLQQPSTTAPSAHPRGAFLCHRTKFPMTEQKHCPGKLLRSAFAGKQNDKPGYVVKDRKSTRLNSSHSRASRMPSSA